MLEIAIPGSATLFLEHLVLDFNGTLAVDGVLMPAVDSAIRPLAEHVIIHVITADTFGRARGMLAALPCEVVVLPDKQQDYAKRSFIDKLGADRCAAIGNGRNDRLMLARAALGIAVIQAEGVAVESLLAAKVVAPDILSAFGLLQNPLRLSATLRT